MHYILFIYLSVYASGGGISVATAEFNDQTACVFAAKKIRDDWKTFYTQTPKVMCLPKGSE